MEQRQSGIELLRLLAMFGIVLSHWGGHGSWEYSPDNTNLTNKVFIQLTQYLGEVSNCIFVMITGYFLASRKSVNKKGIFRIVKDVKFYAFSIWLIVVSFGLIDFNVSGGVLSLLPIIYSQYWFVAPFLVILLLSPWINKILAEMSSNQKKWYFGLLFVVELILPLGYARGLASNIGVFVLFYSVGVQLRYSQDLKQKLMKYDKILVVGGFLLAISSLLLLDMLVPLIGLPQSLIMHFIERFSILPIISALGLLLLFEGMKFQSAIINKLAKSAFAIYLISENPNVYPWFWKKVFDNLEYYDSSYMIGIALMQCLIVCIVCVFIDLCYKKALNISWINIKGWLTKGKKQSKPLTE